MRARLRGTPDFALFDRIPGQKSALVFRQVVNTERIVGRINVPMVGAEVYAEGTVAKSFIEEIDIGFLFRGYVDQPGVRAVRHRLPVVCAAWPRNDFHCFAGFVIAGELRFDRTAGVGIDVGRPVDRHVIFRRQEFPGLAV